MSMIHPMYPIHPRMVMGELSILDSEDGSRGLLPIPTRIAGSIRTPREGEAAADSLLGMPSIGLWTSNA